MCLAMCFVARYSGNFSISLVAKYVEISMYLGMCFVPRYMEISMYRATKYMARYMEISMYVAISFVIEIEITEITSITDKFANRL